MIGKWPLATSTAGQGAIYDRSHCTLHCKTARGRVIRPLTCEPCYPLYPTSCIHKNRYPHMASKHVDVLIIGAGLSGIGAAYHLKKNCPDKTYALLEGRQAIGGTL